MVHKKEQCGVGTLEHNMSCRLRYGTTFLMEHETWESLFREKLELENELLFFICKPCPPTRWFSNKICLTCPRGFSQSEIFIPRNAHQQVGFQAFQGLMAPETSFHHQIY
jgi:hypothetical protein